MLIAFFKQDMGILVKPPDIAFLPHLFFYRLINIFLIFHSTSCSYSLLQQGFENMTNKKIFISPANPGRWAWATEIGRICIRIASRILVVFKPYALLERRWCVPALNLTHQKILPYHQYAEAVICWPNSPTSKLKN